METPIAAATLDGSAPCRINMHAVLKPAASREQGSTHVLKLSILIPAHDLALAENSLASVLQNRPGNCEIVVVHDAGYEDPYDLSREVRFVEIESKSDLLSRLRVGIMACRASIVHVLSGGTEVVEGWTRAALTHFHDARVASVAPLIVEPDELRIVSAGLEYRRGGRRVERARGESIAVASQEPAPVLGPTFRAAFYRREALMALGDPFDAAMGEQLADIDLALRLSHAGYRAMFEPRSRATSPPLTARRRPLIEAWQAERLFWRHARALGWPGSLSRHAAAVLLETATTLFQPWQAGRIVGRLVGTIEHFVSRRQSLTPPVATAKKTRSSSHRRGWRFDPANSSRASRAHTNQAAAHSPAVAGTTDH